MATIRKKGKVYFIDYRVNGKRYRKKVGKTKDVAELALKDIELKIAKNELGFLEVNDPDTKDLFKDFLKHCEVSHSPATFERYKGIINNIKAYLDDYGHATKTSHLTPKLLEEYKIYRRGQKAKTHTVNLELRLIKTLFNWAIKTERVKLKNNQNPADSLTMLKVTDEKKPRFLTEEECKQLLNNCGPALYPVFYTFICTGMRKGELLNLEWNDIDFKRRKIKIRAKEDWRPKSSEREIPISNGLLPLLQGMKKKKKKGINLVFNDGEGQAIPKNRLRIQLISIAKKCGFADVTKIHSLRHTFASHLVMKGVDLPTVQKLMGHSDITTTMIYAHLAPDHLVDAVDKLEL